MIFSTHRRRLDSRRRFGSIEFRNKIRNAANYKRAFNHEGKISIKLFPKNKFARIGWISGLAILLIFAYYFVISDFLLIEQVAISGNQQVSSEQIAAAVTSYGNSRLFLIKKNNFFLMTEARVNEFLSDNIPSVKTVKLSKSWPNQATIEILEHNQGFILESNGNYFLVDDEGVIVSEVDSGGEGLLVRDQLTENFEKGEALPNTKLAPFILSMARLWSTKVSTPVSYVKIVGKSGNDVQFVTTAGWSALFDAQRAVSLQLTDLAVILNKQISRQQQMNLAYIDLRLSKKVFYCFKETPCQQKEINVQK